MFKSGALRDSCFVLYTEKITSPIDFNECLDVRICFSCAN